MSQLQSPQSAQVQHAPGTTNDLTPTPVSQDAVLLRRKRRSARSILIACLAVILAGVIVFAVIVSRGSSPSYARIGDVISTSSWTVTVNNITSSQGNGFLYSPQAGDVYMVIDITLKNNATTAQTSSTPRQWKLSDAQGQAFDEDIFYSNHSPEGSIAPGRQVRGPIAYEVPRTIHSFILQFMPNAGDATTLVRWNLSFQP